MCCVQKTKKTPTLKPLFTFACLVPVTTVFSSVGSNFLTLEHQTLLDPISIRGPLIRTVSKQSIA